MSQLFAFNLARPVEPHAIGERGSYDPHTQLWSGQEQATAWYCTQACGYEGALDCRAPSYCALSNFTSTHPYYACIYVKCD